VSDLELQHRLGYRFNDSGWLEMALTHRSAPGASNERLEFLGDGALNFVIADELFRDRAQSPEGELSRLRASLVNKNSLVEIARSVGLGDCIRLGTGELKSGGHRRDSILADAVESVLGAIYRDGGFAAVQEVIRGLYADRLADLPNPQDLKDAKTRLQEQLQGDGRPVPEYRVLGVEGQDHAQTFEVECRLTDRDQVIQGRAGSRRHAEQAAAAAMIEALQG